MARPEMFKVIDEDGDRLQVLKWDDGQVTFATGSLGTVVQLKPEQVKELRGFLRNE